MTNIAVFASGSGTNAVNLVKTFNNGTRIRVAICLVDRQNAPVIQKMEALGVAVAYYPRSVWRKEPQVILDVLRDNDIKAIALAGFLCIVPPEIVRAYEGRILNIHPSLLPAFGGDGMWGGNVHQAVLDAGVPESGATVHIVTEEVDKGPILLQKAVPVLPDDTAETLEARVHLAEYEIFPQAVIKLLAQLQKESDKSDESDISDGSDESDKSVDDAWAEALGVKNNLPPLPTDESEIPPIPHDETSTHYATHFTSGQAEASHGKCAPLDGTTTHFTSGQAEASHGKCAPQDAEPMPPTYLVWSVIMTILCCFIPGIVAILMSAKVSSRYYAGDIEGAKRASDQAQIWIIVSFVLGVLSATLYVPISLAGGLL